MMLTEVMHALEWFLELCSKQQGVTMAESEDRDELFEFLYREFLELYEAVYGSRVVAVNTCTWDLPELVRAIGALRKSLDTLLIQEARVLKCVS